MKKLFLIAMVFVTTHQTSKAQQLENTAWLFVTHTQKLTEKFDILADFQIRSSNQIDYLTTLLLRTGFAYNLNDKNTVALGYAYKSDWVREHSIEIQKHENRIYQQYQYNCKINTIEITFRGRVEERFLTENTTLFAMRARWFGSLQVPLLANDYFTEGLFAGIQDEVFLNILNTKNVNNSIFDQNRAYVSLGYRFSEHLDTTLDYGLWSQRDTAGDTQTNIFRLSLTTNF